MSMGRKSAKCLRITLDFANLFKAFIGVNYLSTAFALSQSGIALGIIGMLAIATATVHCCHLIIKCKREVIRKILEGSSLRPPSEGAERDESDLYLRLGQIIEKRLSYGAIASITLGKLGIVMVNFALVVTQFGFCVTYFIFLGNTFDKMFSFYLPYIDVLIANSSATVNQNIGVDFEKDVFVGGNGSYPANILPFNLVSKSPGFYILVLIPLPLFILFSYLRSIRRMGPVSIVANISIFIGYVSLLTYILEDFEVSDTVVWFNWATFPIFFGQVTAAYEGIGTIVPIESSMEGNRYLFAHLLYTVMILFTLVLASLGFLGYLRFGTATAQILLWNLGPGSTLELLVSLVVCIGVLFTFPLQVFPVVEIFEEMIFSEGKCCGPPVSLPASEKCDVDTDNDPDEVIVNDCSLNSEHQKLVEDDALDSILHKLPIVKEIPKSVPTWRRNILRTVIVLVQLGIACAFKDDFAYFSALTGAIGSTMLAYIIPAILHLKLKGRRLGIPIIIKDVGLIVFGVVGGVTGIYAAISSIIANLA